MSDAGASQLAGHAGYQRQHAGQTAYIEKGRGEVVLLIHGVGLNGEAWWPQIEDLSETHRVIAIDMAGHGASALPAGEVRLDSYVRQVGTLLDHLGVAQANVIGHSMGGLVAIGFALAHPGRVLRLAVLNSVYERTPEQRSSVVARAREIEASEAMGNIEVPLLRWFGAEALQSASARQVRGWLQRANPRGYAQAYSIFASSDGAFSGRLAALSMPVLFATGSDDPNSTPAMAEAMAKATPHGTSLVLPSQRHMMNLTDPAGVNAALRNLLTERKQGFDLRDLRKAFGSFMTGVTVVTTRERDGTLRGFTANSFSSVSLDPPLLLVCINKAAASCEVFANAPHFAVNILSESQKTVSGIFASKRPDKFTDTSYTLSANGNPLLPGSVAWFDCARYNVIEAGDHIILLGQVQAYAHSDASPLGYARGGYVTLGLEQSAVNAAANVGRTEVGAILECDGKLLVFNAPDGHYELPHVGLEGNTGTASGLVDWLASRGISATLGFLFAVYENRTDRTQAIYYRGDAEVQSATGFTLLDFAALPWEKLRDEPTRSMLRRYGAERLEGRFRIYSGDHVSGDVRDID